MNLEHLRHTLAHLLAAAVKELYPKALATIGPAIEDGFYYDFDNLKISDTDLTRIEEKMRELLPSWTKFNSEEVSAQEAKKNYKDNPYKQELINEITDRGEKITLYTSGEFTDLCRGGHVKNPAKDIDPAAFKLTHIAGAYWRGNEKNKMLTRVYGAAFATKAELAEYLKQREEAKKRDHRVLGRELKIFTFDNLVGSGLPLWLPNGTIIKDEIEKFAVEIESATGYQRVSTPHIAKEELFKMSGHLPYYADLMFPPMELDDGKYYLKAMNCPITHLIYKSEPRSYRDLPLRLAEYGTVYRNELSGTLAGLLRVRMLSMNDAHIYCRRDQIEQEFKGVIDLTLKMFKTFGLSDYSFRLSKWDPVNKDKYINEPENWEFTEKILKRVLETAGVKFMEATGEAAFYGPKVDIQYRSISGREETMSTIQLDFAARELFNLVYHDSNGRSNNEVFVIHRAPLSTHERFIAFLIEHFAGAFPVWLSPVQVSVLPISEKFSEYANKAFGTIRASGIRVEIRETDTLAKRIREAELQKVPYILVVGEKEEKDGSVNVRSRKDDSQKSSKLPDFIKHTRKEIDSREL